MLHGQKAASNAERTAKNTFEKKSIGLDLPSIKIKKEIIKKGINILDLVVLSNLSQSKSEVRRIINNNGIRIDNKIIENDKVLITINHFNENNLLKLSLGKKNHIVIKII